MTQRCDFAFSMALEGRSIVGARVIQRPRERRKGLHGNLRETKAMALVLAAVALPVMLAYILVAADIRSDLSELKASLPNGSEGTELVGWADLERRRGDGRARMIGYMMDIYKPSPDGVQVSTFVLMPEAGQWLHPAHRIPDEMVEVHMVHPVPFKNRELVWVTGRLDRAFGVSGGDRAAWMLTDALVEPASDREITRWFTP
jgi:hypothetical protein